MTKTLLLYYKVKSVVMAKQTVINFKNCINMYIVLHGEVFFLKTKPNEAVTT